MSGRLRLLAAVPQGHCKVTTLVDGGQLDHRVLRHQWHPPPSGSKATRACPRRLYSQPERPNRDALPGQDLRLAIERAVVDTISTTGGPVARAHLSRRRHRRLVHHGPG
jgi:hypothetical protein